MNQIQLETYLSKGVEQILKDILKLSIANPKSAFFMMQYAKASKKAQKLRNLAEKRGDHIPPFLIASITARCNLQCTGCYAQANNVSNDECSHRELTPAQWQNIFLQASELGIGFILLAGGEPLIRRDVLETAGNFKNILFPVFTNGTLLDGSMLSLMSENRNLVPILSIEGNQDTTDVRRGAGIFMKLKTVMAELQNRGILFGVSVTVTKENVHEVMSEAFTKQLVYAGCKAVVYVEYVPADRKSHHLTLDEKTRMYLDSRLEELRKTESELLFVSFPGDEKTSGGCLAAGRGFFHINAHGGAEPCPFSPYSDTDLLTTSLSEALRSPLFIKLRSEEILMQEHTGGCVLFEHEQQVKALMGELNQ